VQKQSFVLAQNCRKIEFHDEKIEFQEKKMSFSIFSKIEFHPKRTKNKPVRGVSDVFR